MFFSWVIWTCSLQDLCETLAWKFFQATSLHSSRAPMSNLQAVYRWCSMRPELCVLPNMWYLGPKIFLKSDLGAYSGCEHATSIAYPEFRFQNVDFCVEEWSLSWMSSSEKMSKYLVGQTIGSRHLFDRWIFLRISK